MSTEATTHTSEGHAENHEGHNHPTVAFYIWIGVALAILTGVEVAIFYIEAFETVEAPLLIILSTAKLILVVMYFMHLKMDARVLTWLFLAGAVLAIFMVSALVILYHVLPGMGG